MSDGLKSKTFHGLFWSFLERIGQQGIQFVISIILARLLLPEQFGLIAMLAIFMGISQAFIDSGFGQALIQKKKVTRIDECSIFYFNIFLGFLAAGFLCLAAPWIADFYNQPLLINLTRAMSLILIINAFGLIQTTLLSKKLDFKTQLKVSVIATVLSGTIGVTMAFKGFGVWSLVAQSLSSNLFRTVLLWFFHHWRPVWTFSFASLRSMFGFSSRILGSGLLETIFQNIYLLVIGRLFSTTDLGFYFQANRTQHLPVAGITSMVGRVVFPVFSSIHDDKARLKRGVRKALTTMVMVSFPLMVGLAIVAKPLIHIILTDKWLPCVPYLQLLCAVGMLIPLQSVNLNVLKAQGRSDLFFRIEILKKALFAIAIAVTYCWGIEAMIYGQIVVSALAYYLNAYYTGKLLDYPITEQIQDVLPTLGLASVMGFGVYMLKYSALTNQTALLLVQIISGIVIYTLLCRVFRLSSFIEVVEITKLQLFKPRHAD